MDNPFNPEDRAVQTALIRLQYFRRAFRVTIKFRAAESTGARQVLASGTIEDGPNNAILRVYNYTFHRRAARNLNMQHNFQDSFEDFGWDPQLHNFTGDGIRFHATVNAHPHHDFAPLGYLAPTPGSPNFPPRRSLLPEANPFVGGSRPSSSFMTMLQNQPNPPGPQPEPSARRLHPRPYDDQLTIQG